MVRIEPLPAERLDEVRRVWIALLEHHGEVAPHMPPVRDGEESWRRRVADYRVWLADPPSFALAASEGDSVVGYALIRVGPGDETWTTGERVAELETLAVVPEARGQGVGSALMDAVEAELGRQGIADLRLGVIASNTRAVAFYEKRGMLPYLTYMYRHLG